MTGMLASVSSLDEARIVFDAGADIIDLKNPSVGALGAVPLKTAREVVRYIDGRCTVSATTGDLPMQVMPMRKAIFDMSACGVDLIKVGLFARELSPDLPGLFAHCHGAGIKLILVLFADMAPDLGQVFACLGRSHLTGIMLDTARKDAGGLTGVVDGDYLESFLGLARQAGLVTGLAGSLKAVDIARLLPLAPDYLGFRGALCRSACRTEQLDTSAVAQVRALIPRGRSARLISCKQH